MTNWIPFTSTALLLATQALVATIAIPNPAGPPFIERPVTAVPQEMCGACDEWEVGEDSWEHWAVDWWNSQGPAEEPGGWHFPAEAGRCDDHHDPCGKKQMRLAEDVIDAVDREDVTYLAGLVDESSVVVVESRQALQIPGCDGKIIVGHVPVGRAMMNTLQVAASELADPQ